MKKIYIAIPKIKENEKVSEYFKFIHSACHFVNSKGHAFLCPHSIKSKTLLNRKEKAISTCDECWIFGNDIDLETFLLLKNTNIPIKKINKEIRNATD